MSLTIAIILVCFEIRVAYTNTNSTSLSNDTIADPKIVDVTFSAVKIEWALDNPANSMYDNFHWEYGTLQEPCVSAKLPRKQNSNEYTCQNAYEAMSDIGWSRAQQYRPHAIQVNQTHATFLVDGLRYPGFLYKIRLSRKATWGQKGNVSIAVVSENQIVHKEVRTQAMLPDPPKLDVGAYQFRRVLNHEEFRTIRIYWTPVMYPDEFNLTYEFTTYYTVWYNYSNIEFLSEIATRKASEGWYEYEADFRAHTFIARARNVAGYSERSSILKVPRHRQWLRVPKLTLQYDAVEQRTVLSWRKPEQSSHVFNYTIFWIKSIDGGIVKTIYDYVVVSNNTTSFVVGETGMHSPFLAVSVNSEDGSSGLQIPRWN